MLKCGFRKLHFYPLMFLLFAILRKTVETILRCQPYTDYLDFLIPLLIFFSQCLFGLIIYLCYSKKNIFQEVALRELFFLLLIMNLFYYYKINLP